MTKNKKIIITTSLIAVALLILILGTIFDLQISKGIASLTPGRYYSANFFAIFFECIGEDILYLLIIASCGILFHYLLQNPLNKKWLHYLLLVIIGIVAYLVAVYLFYVTLDNIAPYSNEVTNYLDSTVGKITIFILPTIIVLGAYLLLGKLKPEIITALWKWALIVIIVAVVSNGIVQIAKHIFDRTRFRAMVYFGDEEFSHFTNWFAINKNKNLPQGLYTDVYKSFPSGHTCAASSTFLLVLLPIYLQKLNTKQNKIILWVVASIYTFLVAISRIVAGAHFFTDVYIAFLITLGTIFLTYYVFNLIIKKINNKNSQQPNENANDKNEKILTNTKENGDKA